MSSIADALAARYAAKRSEVGAFGGGPVASGRVSSEFEFFRSRNANYICLAHQDRGGNDA
jgi:hypothetical protein